MRYYAHFGHTDFVLCLGYGADTVKDYFLNYHETHSNDFVLSEGGAKVDEVDHALRSQLVAAELDERTKLLVDYFAQQLAKIMGLAASDLQVDQPLNTMGLDSLMAIELKMPALSPTMEEGTLAKWLVKEGDAVSSGTVLAEIETDKATMEFESIDEGTVGKILVPEGTEGVKVNTPIAVILSNGEDASAATSGGGASTSSRRRVFSWSSASSRIARSDSSRTCRSSASFSSRRLPRLRKNPLAADHIMRGEPMVTWMG